MTSMVEKVARAIYEEDDVWSAAFPWPNMPSSDQSADNYRRIARAAIQAMREPDIEVIGAFWRQKNCGTQEIGHRGKNTDDYSAWRAAIDAALKEE